MAPLDSFGPGAGVCHIKFSINAPEICIPPELSRCFLWAVFSWSAGTKIAVSGIPW